MKKKQLYLFMSAIILINGININISYANSNLNNSIEENYKEDVYLENEYFKILYIGKESESIMPINSLKVFTKQTNTQIGNGTWSSAVLLSNGNCILGNFENGKYSYYEVNKKGEINFLINTNYYIKDIIKGTENYIIIKPYNLDGQNQYLLGILDKEFKVIYEPIFEYKNVKFENGYEVLKPLGEKYGLYSINGNNVIQPIFDNLNYNTLNTINATYNNNIYILEKNGKGYKNTTTIKNIDPWAKDYVLKCIEMGLVSDSLQLKFKNSITREEFCEVIIKLYELKTGLEIDINEVKNPFLDTNNKNILKAYKLDIVSGKSTNKFEPNTYLTREEAAVILYNLMNSMGIPIKETNKVYLDNNEISGWAYNSVMAISSAGIMSGSNNYFNPKDKITVQEALIAIYRI